MSFLVFMRNFFASFVLYKDYLIQSVARDLRKRYRRSVLGYLWSMLHPLMMMVILSIVFSNLMKGTTGNYPVFLFCGILSWAYFSSTVTSSLYAVKGNMQIISQIPVPKYIFLLSLALSGLFTFTVTLVPLLVVMLVTGAPLHATTLALPLVVLPLVILTIGISLIVSVFNVFFEDTEHLNGIFIQALYFLSPVLYSREILPDWLGKYIEVNPLFPIIEFTRDLIMKGVFPSPSLYLCNLLYCGAWLLAGLYVFKRADNKFIYYT